MQKVSKKIVVIILLIGLAVPVMFYMIVGAISDGKNHNEHEHSTASTNKVADASPTVASEWQWQQMKQNINKSQLRADNKDSLPFTEESIYNALQAVKFDENGNIILDHDALISLDEALERIHNKLDSETLSILQDIIRQALPGLSGEQTAKIVGDYYVFLEAKEEFSNMAEGLSDENAEPTLSSLENDESLYAELQSLRQVHLGSEATDSLFRVSDANAKFMFDSMKLGLDTSLTPQQREQQQQQIEAQHQAQSINVADWPARYQAFMTAKQSITSASIDDDEKRAQIAQLLRQYFNHDELKEINHLGLEAL